MDSRSGRRRNLQRGRTSSAILYKIPGRAWSVRRKLCQEVDPFLGSEMVWWSSKADAVIDVQQAIV